MSKETVDIVHEIDWKDIEMQIAFHCAPLIAGLKLSNLLMLRNEDLDRATSLLKRAGLSYFVVAVTNGKAAVLLFDRHRLEAYLREEKVWQIFQDMGYQDHAMGKILYAFRQRYEGYLLRNQEFPNEMATFDDFMKLDIRVGTIVEAVVFEKAKKPAYQLQIDFGNELGIKKHQLK